MMRRCMECSQLVRVVDPETGCRPWLAEHRTANGKRKCDGSLTGQFVEAEVREMAEPNEDLSVAGGNRRERSRQAREFLKTLAPELTYTQARAAAQECGIVLSQSTFYGFRTGGPPGPVAAPAEGPPALPRAVVTPQPTMLALRELAQLVSRIGGFDETRSALDLLEDLAAATAGGAP